MTTITHDFRDRARAAAGAGPVQGADAVIDSAVNACTLPRVPPPSPRHRPDRPPRPRNHRRGGPPHAGRIEHGAHAHGDRHRELVALSGDERLVARHRVLADPRGESPARVRHRDPQGRERGLELPAASRPHHQDPALDDARVVDGLALHQRRPGQGEPSDRGLRHRHLLRGRPRRRGGVGVHDDAQARSAGDLGPHRAADPQARPHADVGALLRRGRDALRAA